ncbi:MAG: FMN-binding protein [Eubacterium sp.]|nr:FMN-binding protein [Eubacterium sp.]
MKKETSLGHDILIITVITLVAGLLLGLVHNITAGPIAAQEEKTRIETQKAVFPSAASFEAIDGVQDDPGLIQALEDDGLTKTTVNAVDAALDENGDLLGYVVTSTNSEGYGGNIQIMTGIDTSGDGLVINDIRFLTLAETAGMGMKAQEPEFLDQFTGMQPGDQDVVYTKNGKSADNEIDAISGSTITTSSVTKDVNAALTAVRYLEGGAA